MKKNVSKNDSSFLENKFILKKKSPFHMMYVDALNKNKYNSSYSSAIIYLINYLIYNLRPEILIKLILVFLYHRNTNVKYLYFVKESLRNEQDYCNIIITVHVLISNKL